MKVFIWLGCFFVPAFIKVLLQNNGIGLGAIPTVILYGAALWAARHLCQKWDERKRERDEEN